MVLRDSPRVPQVLLPLVLGIVAWALTGCASDPYNLGKTARVKGRVTVGGVPLDTGIVTFHPDAARGNTTPHQPSASIDENGMYDLFTVGQTAAPLGWYKVLVTAVETDEHLAKRATRGKPRSLPKSLISLKYEDVKTTPLSQEVVERSAAGAYDLKLSP